jgi:hypothetical protein
MTKTELNTLWKEYPYEFKEMSLHELKLLVSWRMKMMGMTRWDEFQDEFIDDLRRTHNDYLLGLGLETDREQLAQEDS